MVRRLRLTPPAGHRSIHPVPGPARSTSEWPCGTPRSRGYSPPPGSRQRDYPHRRIVSRVRRTAKLELRCKHCQANARLETNSGKILSRPAAINDKRHDPSQSSRTPSRSNNREGRYGLSEQASNAQAQKKSTVGRTKLGDTKRSIRLEAKNTAHGTREQQPEAAEYRGHKGSAVWQ